LSGIETELRPKGFEVVEAAVNPNADIPGFIAQFKPPFPVGTADAQAALQYLKWPPDKRPLVPLMVFIDRKGILRDQFTGADTDFFNDQTQDQHIRSVAEKLLNEHAAPARAKKRAKKK
jgi:hypothetical protein